MIGDLVVVARVRCAGAGVCVAGLATLDDYDWWLVTITVFPR
jgi:hypothetical protein